MKLKVHCPACGNRELSQLFIKTQKGKDLSLLLSSQSDIRKSSGDVCCVICHQVYQFKDLPSRK